MADSDLNQTSFNVFEPVGTIEDPDITPSSGTYNDVVRVTVDGHTNPPFKIRQLHVTTDGADPMPNVNTSGESSPKQLTVRASTTVKALAGQLGWHDSSIVTREYILVCATPEIATADAGPTTKTVTITSNTPNATLRYTADGSPVTDSSTAYNTPFQIGVGTTVINAKCFRNGFIDSPIATEVVLIEEQVAPTITQQPQSQTVDGGTDVSFNVQATAYPPRPSAGSSTAWTSRAKTEPVLDVPGVQLANAGDYRAIATNAAGTVTSTVATLTVNGTAHHRSVRQHIQSHAAGRANLLRRQHHDGERCHLCVGFRRWRNGHWSVG